MAAILPLKAHSHQSPLPVDSTCFVAYVWLMWFFFFRLFLGSSHTHTHTSKSSSSLFFFFFFFLFFCSSSFSSSSSSPQSPTMCCRPHQTQRHPACLTPATVLWACDWRTVSPQNDSKDDEGGESEAPLTNSPSEGMRPIMCPGALNHRLLVWLSLHSHALFCVHHCLLPSVQQAFATAFFIPRN